MTTQVFNSQEEQNISLLDRHQLTELWSLDNFGNALKECENIKTKSKICQNEQSGLGFVLFQVRPPRLWEYNVEIYMKKKGLPPHEAWCGVNHKQHSKCFTWKGRMISD